QLAFGFIDVYPMALALMAVYLASAVASLCDDLHPAWPALVLAVGPFFYVGLVLLAPSALVVALAVVRRPGGLRQLCVAAAVAVGAAGAATLPGYGLPFAWRAFVDGVRAASQAELGLSPTSSLLPLDYLFSRWHAYELFHELVLLDGVGALLVVVLGAWSL